MPGISLFGRLGKLGAIVCLALALSGCAGLLAGGGDSNGDVDKLQAENKELKAKNDDLQTEIEDLQKQVAEAETKGDSANIESPESTQPESTQVESKTKDNSGDNSGGGSGGGDIAVAGDGDVSGKEVPDIMPNDFPLPSGAVLDYTNEGDYDFSLDFVLDSDL